MTTLIKRQSGVALISVLLIFAIAAVIAAEVMSRSYRDIHKTGNLINSKQATLFALSGEQYARQILYRDFIEQQSRGNPVDRLADNWALNFQPFDIEGGEMTIVISDLQGRFNLNNLVDSNGAVNITAANEFRRLQTILDLSSDYTDLIIDWIDFNRLPRGNGGEDDVYNQGYLPANAPMADKTELRLIKGMDRQDFLKLAPLVVALPKQLGKFRFDDTKYNINTVDAKLLEAISTLSSNATQQVEARQQKGGYDTLQQWLNTPEGANLNAVSGKLSVNSEFFEIVVKANYQQRISVLTATLFRNSNDGKLTIIKRQSDAG